MKKMIAIVCVVMGLSACGTQTISTPAVHVSAPIQADASAPHGIPAKAIVVHPKTVATIAPTHVTVAPTRHVYVPPKPVKVVPKPVVAKPKPVVTIDPMAAFNNWLLHPTFTCPEGKAPGWLNDKGIPTGCVSN